MIRRKSEIICGNNLPLSSEARQVSSSDILAMYCMTLKVLQIASAAAAAGLRLQR
jgi:hypothetical protein